MHNPSPSPLRIENQLLLLMLLVLTWYSLAPLVGVHIAYADDAWHALFGETCKSFREAFDNAALVAVSNGRFGSFFGCLLVYFAYSGSQYLLDVVRVGMVFSNVVLFGWVLFLSLRCRWSALAILSFFLGSLTITGTSMISGFPGVFTTALSLLLLAVALELSSQETPSRNRTVVICLSLWFSACLYESFILFLPLIAILRMARVWYPRSTEGKLRKTIQALGPVAVTGVCYIAIYVLFKLLFPGNYDGAQVSRELSIMPMLNVVWRFTITGTPFIDFFHDVPNISRTYLLPGDALEVLNSYPLTSAWYLRAFIGAALVYLGLHNASPLNSRRTIIVMGAFLYAGISWHILQATTLKYQAWAKGNWTYVTCYFSFYTNCALIVLFILALVTRTRRILRTIVCFVAASVAFTASLLSSVSSDFNSKEQKAAAKHIAVFESLVDQLNDGRLQDGAILNFPSAHRILMYGNRPYLEASVQQRTGLAVKVTTSAAELESETEAHPDTTVWHFSAKRSPRGDEMSVTAAPDRPLFSQGYPWSYHFVVARVSDRFRSSAFAKSPDGAWMALWSNPNSLARNRGANILVEEFYAQDLVNIESVVISDQATPPEAFSFSEWPHTVLDLTRANDGISVDNVYPGTDIHQRPKAFFLHAPFSGEARLSARLPRVSRSAFCAILSNLGEDGDGVWFILKVDNNEVFRRHIPKGVRIPVIIPIPDDNPTDYWNLQILVNKGGSEACDWAYVERPALITPPDYQ